MSEIKLVYRESDQNDPRSQKAKALESDQWVVKWETRLEGNPMEKTDDCWIRFSKDELTEILSCLKQCSVEYGGDRTLYNSIYKIEEAIEEKCDKE